MFVYLQAWLALAKGAEGGGVEGWQVVWLVDTVVSITQGKAQFLRLTFAMRIIAV